MIVTDFLTNFTEVTLIGETLTMTMTPTTVIETSSYSGYMIKCYP